MARGQWYRLLTPVLLHADVVHIGLNAYALWILGPPVERALGTARFLAVFVFAGFAGEAASYAFAPCASAGIGSSGAVFGVLGGLVLMAYRRRRADPSAFQRMLVITALMLLIGFLLPRPIGNLAHVGGLVGGFLLTAGVFSPPDLLSLGERRTSSVAVRVVVTVAVVAAVLALVWWRTATFTCFIDR